MSTKAKESNVIPEELSHVGVHSLTVTGPNGAQLAGHELPSPTNGQATPRRQGFGHQLPKP